MFIKNLLFLPESELQDNVLRWIQGPAASAQSSRQQSTVFAEQGKEVLLTSVKPQLANSKGHILCSVTPLVPVAEVDP